MLADTKTVAVLGITRAYATRHGVARTLRQKLAQEAAVLAASDAPGPKVTLQAWPSASRWR